jgi:hypothetical protein
LARQTIEKIFFIALTAADGTIAEGLQPGLGSGGNRGGS